jgi:uncharacterized protein
LLSGMFGVGGGFLTTPLLIVYGIPPTVAAASSASQVTGASVSGVFAHFRRGGVDMKMGGVLVAGGIVGSVLRRVAVPLLQTSGQIDTVIASSMSLMLGSIGGLMARESFRRDRRRSRKGRAAPAAQAAPSPAGRRAAAAHALLRLGPLHLAARAAAARLLHRHPDDPARDRRRLHLWFRR